MKAKEMKEITQDEKNLIPPDISPIPFTTNESDITIGEANMQKPMSNSIVKAANVFIKGFSGDCESIAKELKGSLTAAYPGLWLCAVSKGTMGATTSVNKGKEMFFKILDFRFFVSQLTCKQK